MNVSSGSCPRRTLIMVSFGWAYGNPKSNLIKRKTLTCGHGFGVKLQRNLVVLKRELQVLQQTLNLDYLKTLTSKYLKELNATN